MPYLLRCLIALFPLVSFADPVSFEVVVTFSDGKISLECQRGCLTKLSAVECRQNECTATVQDPGGASIHGGAQRKLGVAFWTEPTGDVIEPEFEVVFLPKDDYVEVQCNGCESWQIDRFDCDFPNGNSAIRHRSRYGISPS